MRRNGMRLILCGLAALLTFALNPYAEKRRGGPVSVT